MRIISGKARGTKINTIDNISTRPTLDRVRESLFNIIQNEIRDKMILDLFAGSGALGIEALSRGAKHCVFCDINPQAVDIINHNLNKTKLDKYATTYLSNYKKCIKKLSEKNEKIDIAFIDPPYKEDLAVISAIELLKNGILHKSSTIIIETDMVEREKKELDNNKHFLIYDERKYGRANLLFLRLNEEN